MDDVTGVPIAKLEMVYKVSGTPVLMRRPLRGGLEGAKRTAQHLITRGLSRVEWVEIRASGVVVYKTTQEEWS